MIYIWDTDTFSWWQRHAGAFQDRSLSLGDESAVALAAVTVFEAVRGRVAIVAQARDEMQYARALSAMLETLTATRRWTTLAYTPEAAARFAHLRRGRGNRGASDLRVAAIALSVGAVLVTRNAADFADIPGLATENWTD